jgi:hypothetical protein
VCWHRNRAHPAPGISTQGSPLAGIRWVLGLGGGFGGCEGKARLSPTSRPPCYLLIPEWPGPGPQAPS